MSPFRNVQRKLFGRSLSARVLWLTVSIILLVEMLILVPSLGRERQAWLWQHVTQAHLAAFPAAVTNRIPGALFMSAPGIRSPPGKRISLCCPAGLA